MIRCLKAYLIVCCLTACTSRSVPEAATSTLERFLASAVAGDSTAVAQMTTNSDPVQRILALHNHEPDLLAALLSNREPVSATIDGDTAFVAFRVLVATHTETVTIGLVRSVAGTWAVYYFAIPSRG